MIRPSDRLPTRSRSGVCSAVLMLGLAVLSGGILHADDLKDAAKLIAAGDRPGAVRLYDRWLDGNGSHADTASVLMSAVSLVENAGEAVSLLTKHLPSMTIPSDRHRVIRRLAEIEEAIGRYADAQAHYEEAAYAVPGAMDFKSYLASARLLFALGDGVKAESRVQAVLLTSLDAEVLQESHLLHARILSAQSRDAEAVELLEKQRMLHPERDTPASLLLLGVLYLKAGRDASGTTVLGELARRYPTSPEAGVVQAGGDGKPTVELFPEPSLLLELSPALTNQNLALDRSSTRPAAAGDPGPVWVQTGSFEKRENAESMVAGLGRQGFPAVVRPADVRGKTWYRVFLTQTGTIEAARALLLQLKGKGFEALLAFE